MYIYIYTVSYPPDSMPEGTRYKSVTPPYVVFYLETSYNILIGHATLSYNQTNCVQNSGRKNTISYSQLYPYYRKRFARKRHGLVSHTITTTASSHSWKFGFPQEGGSNTDICAAATLYSDLCLVYMSLLVIKSGEHKKVVLKILDLFVFCHWFEW